MQPLTKLNSRVVALPLNDIDTDQIIPARFLKVTDKADLAANLFADWRFTADGSPRPDFVLNQPQSRGAQILFAGNNFGCGSSREHAPISIKAAGISCVVAESFARIFFRNAINIGLPIVECAGVTELVKEGDTLTVDLGEGRLLLPTGASRAIAPFPPFMEAIVKEGGWIPYLLATGARGEVSR